MYGPSTMSLQPGAIDWVRGPLESTLIVTGQGYVARFCPDTRVCSDACRYLMTERNKYKRWKDIERDKQMQLVWDQTQYA